MEMAIVVPAPATLDPESSEAIALANNAASRLAAVWTEPRFVAAFEQVDPTTEGSYPPGWRMLRYVTDAVPKTTVTTTDNAAPALLPPTIA